MDETDRSIIQENFNLRLVATLDRMSNILVQLTNYLRYDPLQIKDKNIKGMEDQIKQGIKDQIHTVTENIKILQGSKRNPYLVK
ncbi:MAG: hypothetical protein AABX39_02280 [Nanoarchaeota archaeon]